MWAPPPRRGSARSPAHAGRAATVVVGRAASEQRWRRAPPATATARVGWVRPRATRYRREGCSCQRLGGCARAGGREGVLCAGARPGARAFWSRSNTRFTTPLTPCSAWRTAWRTPGEIAYASNVAAMPMIATMAASLARRDSLVGEAGRVPNDEIDMVSPKLPPPTEGSRRHLEPTAVRARPAASAWGADTGRTRACASRAPAAPPRPSGAPAGSPRARASPAAWSGG